MKKKGIIILIISVILVLLIIGGTTTAIVVSNQQVNNNIIIPDIDDDQVFEYDGEEHQPKIKNLDGDELKKVVFSYAEKKDDSPEDEMYQSGLPKNAGIYFVKVDYEDNTQFKTMTINHVEITPEEDVSVIYNQQDIIYTNYFTSLMDVSKIEFNSYFTNPNKEKVEGKVTLDVDKLEPSVSTYAYTFTPNDSNYMSYHGKVDIIVYARVSVLDEAGNQLDYDEVEYNSSFKYKLKPDPGYEQPIIKDSDNNIVTAETKITNDITLVQYDVLTNYAITYHLDGGTNSSNNPSTYTIETETIQLNPATKKGYKFIGWYLEDNFDTLVKYINKGSIHNKEFYARFEKETYQIAYNLDGGLNSLNNPSQIQVVDTVELEPASKAGYTFKGWYLNNELITTLSNISSDITIYAMFEINTYTIHFESNGGSNIGDLVLEYNAEIFFADAPSKNYYSFVGWYVDSELDSVFKDTKMPAKNITLYAKYTPAVYSINYVLNGAEDNLNPDSYTIETPTIVLSEVSLTGYEFAGWYTESAFTNRVYEITQGSHDDITLYAKFTIDVYQITFHSNGGTEYQVMNVEYDTSVNLPTPKKSGYEFVGWFKNQELTIPVSQTFTATETLDLYAKYNLLTYAITYYNVEGLENNNPASYTVETDTLDLLDVSKEGYTFKGWYSDDSFETKVESIVKSSTGNKEFYAKFEAINFEITYFNVDGVVNPNPNTYTIEDEFVLQALTKPGYTFKGWYKEATFENSVLAIEKGTTGPQEFYAKFELDTYTITYNLDGTNGANPDTYTYEMDTIVLLDPTKSGYDFIGWYLEDTYETKVTEIEKGSTGNKVFYAKFEIHTYTIAYENVEDATNTNPDIYTVETPTITLVSATKSGYEFGGWYLENTFETRVYTIEEGQIGNITLFAKFDLVTYTITYNNVEGATNINPATYTIVSDDITLQNPEKSGYAFEGWYLDEEFNTAVSQILKGSTGNKVFYAKFILEGYTITYHNLEGATNGDNPLAYSSEDETIVLKDATKPGYTFAGWYRESTFDTKVTKIDSGSIGNKEFYAKFEIVTYTITYNNVEGATNTNPATYTVETSTFALTNATKDYYTFAGWYLEDTFETEVTEVTLGQTGNKVFYAKFTPVTYTITYNNVEGAENTNPTEYTYESAKITLVAATKDYYTFVGWYLEDSFTTRVYQIDAKSYGDKVFYAKFTPVAYTITYNADGGVHTNPDTYTVEDAKITLTEAFKTGYTFDGWYLENTFETKIETIEAGSHENKVFYAKFNAINYTITYNNVEGATNTNPATYTILSDDIVLQDAAKAGYTFDGWYLENTFTTRVYKIDSGSTGNKIFYAKFTVITYTITYHVLDGATNTNPATYTVETPTFALANAAKDYYNFIGWYKESTFETAVTEVEVGTTGNMDLYAKLEAIVYTITYTNVDGATNTNPTEYTYESAKITLANATKDYYTFGGWYLENTFTNRVYEIEANSNGNKEFYAKWTPITYTITYMNLDGATNGANPDTYTVEDATITLLDATKIGYDFVGWYLEADFQTQVTEIALGSHDNMALYAKFTPSTNTAYTVKHLIENLDGTYQIHQTEPKTGTTGNLTQAEFMTINHFTPVGSITQVEILADGSTVVELRYSRDSYTVTFEYRSGLTTDLEFTSVEKNIKYQQEIGQFPIELTIDKYSYEIFDILGNTVTTSEVVSGDITYYVDYTLRTLSIAYHNVEVAISPVEASAGTSVTLATASKNGYDFGGWATTVDGAKVYDGNQTITMPSDSLDLYAIWTVITYSITYNLNGATNGANPANYTIETPTITLLPATKDGYTFAGWFLENTFNTEVTEITLGTTGDQELFAKFEIITYTITYNNIDGATNANPATYTVETPTITLVDSTKTGYDFIGWYLESTFNTAVTTIALGSMGDKVFYAKFEAHDYTITYNNVEGATNTNPATYTVEDTTITLVDPTKNGYTFAGWYSDSLFANRVYEIETGSTGNQVFYAKWTPITYSITYNNVEGATNTNLTSYTIEDATITLVAASKTGYDFVGWYLEDSFDTPATEITSGSTGPKVFYAKFEILTYTITYNNVEGTTNTNPATYTILSDTIVLANPTKTGYDFAGWYTESTFENPVTQIVTGTAENKTFYAKFVAHTYTITYNVLDGTTNTNPTTYTIETATTLLANASKTGYTFDGWYLENTYNTAVTEITLGTTGDLVFYAKQTIITYTISYNLDEGVNGANPDEFTVESSTIVLNEATKTGYDFVGWYTESTYDNQVFEIEAGSHNSITLYAKFEIVTYTITYVLYEGTNGANPATYTVEDSTIALVAASKTGYDFVGWYLESTFDTSVTEITTGSTGNKKFYAKFEAHEYTITYNNVDGLTNNNPTTYKITSDTVTLASVAKDGYTFDGWFTEATFENAVHQIASGSTEDKVFYAKFSTITYTITYNNIDGATNTNPTTYTVETPTFALANATKTGYTFVGWYSDSTLNTLATGITLGSTGNKIFYAKWQVENYTITYNNVDGATNTNPTTYNIETSTITLVAAERNGYTFDGWYLENTFNTRVYEIIVGSTGAKTFYAKWTAKSYTITYNNVDGATNTNPTTYTIETNTITLAVPTKTGYDFVGWYLESTFNTAVTTIAKGSTGNKVFYAKFIAHSYSIEYQNAQGTTNTNPTTYTIEDADITLQALTKTGYDFAGWYLESTFTTRVYTIASGSTGDKVFYAKFTATPYSITYYNCDSATNTNPTTYTIEDVITLTNPTKSGYTFVGWYLESTFTTQASGIQLGSTGAKAFYAKFESQVYTITYVNCDGATNSNPSSYTSDSATIVLANPTKNGYNFIGWYLESTFTTQAYSIDSGSNENKTFYAKFEAITYTITYNLDGGTNGANPTTYTIETPTITLLDATKSGFEFYGWYRESTHNTQVLAIPQGSTGNLVLYAYFDVSAYHITYVLNGGTNNANNITLFTASTPSFTLQNPTKGNAYTFAGWYLESTFDTRILAIDTENTAHDIIVYAKWSPLQYTILYYDGSERITSLSHNSYTVEDDFNLETYSKFNFTFYGWYTDPEFTHQMTKISAGSTGTIKLYAKTEDKGFTVKFYDTDGTTLLSQQTCATYGSVTAPSYTYDNAVYVLKWVDAQGEVADLSRVDANYVLHAQLIVISYNATVYFVDADGYASAKTSNLAITNTTSSSLNYGSNISLIRQMRVTDGSSYDFFYMSPVTSFDWNLAVAAISTGNVATNADKTMSAYVTINDTTGDLTIYVYCIQPVAIITGGTQTLAFSQNLDMSTSTYQFYSTIDEAFEALSNSGKLLRIYGRMSGGLTTNCLDPLVNTSIAKQNVTVNGVILERPAMVYHSSDSVLHHSYTLTAGSILLPYYRGCTTVSGTAIKGETDNGKYVHSAFVIDEGVTLELSINLTVGGEIWGKGQGTGTVNVARHGVIMNKGKIIQNSGSILTVYGFIKGSGNVESRSGSVLDEIFMIYDWPGGTNASSLYPKDIFPIQCYSIHNISCNTRVYSGATYKTYMQFYMRGFYENEVILIGEGGLFQLTSGYIDKSIKETVTSNINTNVFSYSNVITVKDVLDIHGDFFDNIVTVTISSQISTSTSLALPIGFMEIKISEGSGSLSKNSYKFLPGSLLEIGPSGSLTIGSSVTLIAYEYYGYNYSGFSYRVLHPQVFDSDGNTKSEYLPKIMVNGTLTSKGSLGGRIYTDTSSGTLSLTKTSASLPICTALSSGSVTVANDTIYPTIYLYGSDSFSWTNAAATTYSSITALGEFGFTLNTNVTPFTLIYNYLNNQKTSTINTSESTYQIEASDLPDYQVDGYILEGWYIDNGYTISALGYEISSDQNLYAKMTPIMYNIEYHVAVLDEYDESQPIINTNLTYFTLEDTVSLVDASCGTLEFYGWYVDSAYTVSAPNITSSTFKYYKLLLDGNTLHLYGYLSSFEYYTIVYYDKDNQLIESIEPQTVLAGTSITMAPALDSYTDVGDLNTSDYAYYLYVFDKWEIFNTDSINPDLSSITPIATASAGSTYQPGSTIVCRASYRKDAKYVSISQGTLTDAAYSISYGGNNGMTGNVYVPEGTVVTIVITYSKASNRQYSFVASSGGKSGESSSETATISYTALRNTVVNASSKDSGCFTPDTLIALADGSQKEIQDLTGNEKILVWNFFTGQYEEQSISILVNHGYATYDVLHMIYSDGTELKTINEHGIFDYDLNKFVYPTEGTISDYIGHHFVKYNRDTNSYDLVTLEAAYYTTEFTCAYSISSAYTSNALAEDLLTVAPPEDFYNWITMSDKLRYDVEEFNNDVQTYGLYTYDDFKDYVTYEQFVEWNGAYLKIAVEKGYFTYEYIIELINLYQSWFTTN